MTRITLILALLAAPAHAVTGNASIDNPGQTDDNPGQTTGEIAEGSSELGDHGGAVRWSPDREKYNLDPKYTCASMRCDETQGGDR